MVAALEHDASAPPARALVEVRDLHFSYDDNAVLKGINLAIPRGKVVAILGVGGAGRRRRRGGRRGPARGGGGGGGRGGRGRGDAGRGAGRRGRGRRGQ